MSFLGQNLMILCEFHVYTYGISIALAIHSFDPLGLRCVGFIDLFNHAFNITLFKSENLKADEAMSALGSKMRITGQDNVFLDSNAKWERRFGLSFLAIFLFDFTDE